MENNRKETALIVDSEGNGGFSPEFLALNPYPGLNSYDEQRAGFFQGRDREKQSILQILDLYSLCFLIGKSGLGKSSLINAGLVPELKRTGFVPIKIRINFDSEIDLCVQVKTTIEDEIRAIDATAITFKGRLLWEYFQSVKIFNGYLKPVLIFDQFEEIFTRGQKRQAELNDLLAEIIDLAENKVPKKVQQMYVDKNQTIPSGISKDYRIIFALREDYLPQLTSLKNHIPTLKFSLYRLEQMAGAEAFKAVYLPAQKSNQALMDKETAWEIIKKMPESNDDELDIIQVEGRGDSNTLENKRIEPFLLNLFCYTLNEERKERNAAVITKTDVLNKDLGKLVKEYYEKITGASWRLSAAIEAELITPDGKYRKFSSEGDFTNGGKFLNIAGRLRDTDVQYLVDKKIIRRKRINDINYFELIHDILVPVVLQKRKIRHRVYRSLTVLLIAAGLLVAISGYYKLKLLQTQNIVKKLTLTIRQNEKDLQTIKASKLKELSENGVKDLTLVQQQVTDSLHKKAISDSLQQQAQITIIQRGNTVQTQQKARIDSLYQQTELDKVKQTSQQNTIQQATQVQSYQDSVLRIYSAGHLAGMADNLQNITAKRSAAKLAYDTLPKNIKISDEFIPKLFSALTASLIDSLTHKKFYYPERDQGYKNLSDILVSGNTFYLSQPFKSIITGNGVEVLKEPGLVKSWIDQTGDIIAVETVSAANKLKTLLIKNIKNGNTIGSVNLAINQDITSLLFDAKSISCIYSTNQPSAVYRLTLQPGAQPKAIYTANNLKSNEYLLLAKYGDDKFAGISNLGKYITWDNDNTPTVESTKNAAVKGIRISAITAVTTLSRGIFIGCVNGEVYHVDAKGNFHGPLLAPNGKNAKVTSIELSPDGKWLAAGYLNNAINIWRLTPDGWTAANLLSGQDLNGDDISSLKFMPRQNELIAITSLGYICKFPLSMKALANKICTDGNFIRNNTQWKTYMPTVKFQDICK